MTLDTGDNRPLTGSALKRAAGLLARQGFRLLKPIEDRAGTYAYMIGYTTMHGPFYVVARGAPPMIWGLDHLHVVSTQKALLTIARQEDRPILMAIFMTSDPDRPVWMLYHPAEVLEKTLGENRRAGIVMTNYEYDLGEQLIQPQNVANFWDRLRHRWDENRGLFQTKLGRPRS